MAILQPTASQVKLSLEGDDADAFELGVANECRRPALSMLQFKKSPNFEAPIDANQDNALQGNGGRDRQEEPHRYEEPDHRSR